ncbi:MAG: Hpt domain-containing protein [Halodesulfovibrio sp.]
MPAPESPPQSLSLSVAVVDPLETNRALLAIWIQAAAEELAIRCDIQSVSDLPACHDRNASAHERAALAPSSEPCALGELGGVIMLSPLLAASWNAGAGAQNHVLWVHGEIPPEISANTAGGVLNGLSDTRSVPWPVKQAGMRRILAEAAVQFGAVGACGPDAPFGQPVPELLLPLVPRLVESICELWEQCGQHLDNADNAEAVRAAHSLKGAALSFGQRLLAECAGSLMIALEKGNAQEAKRCRALMDKAVQMAAGSGGEG